MLPLRTQAQNVVTQWNDIAITQARASTEPGATSSGATSLYVAYVELAVYNSVVAIEGRFKPYEYSVPAAQGASPDAAAVEAAYRMLLHLLPDRADALTAAYNSSMAAIPDGPGKTDGQTVGQSSANALIFLARRGWPRRPLAVHLSLHTRARRLHPDPRSHVAGHAMGGPDETVHFR